MCEKSLPRSDVYALGLSIVAQSAVLRMQELDGIVELMYHVYLQ